MKLGFVSAILDTWNYEEMMDFASDHGFECVEVASVSYTHLTLPTNSRV